MTHLLQHPATIRVGSFLSEHQDYTERPEAHDKRLRKGPESARAPNLVVDQIEIVSWRGLRQKAFNHTE